MKQIKIVRIEYTNFKGIDSYVLDLEESNANVYAKNKTGKTTLYDGFNWLLFDKNSQEQAQFRIKPFDKDGNDILGTDTSVEAELIIDGERVILRKELLEKWTNPKGSIEKVRGKDVKKYFINGIPTKTKKEYTEFISSVIDEQAFKLLTNPAFFPSKGWDERRKILLDLVDEVSIDDVIEENPDFEVLKEPLEKNTLDEFKQGVSYQLKELQKKAADLNTRIDEANQSIPKASKSKARATAELTQTTKELEELQKEETEIMNGGAVAKYKKEMDELQSQISDGRIKFSQSNQTEIEDLQVQLNELSGKFRAAEDNLYEATTAHQRLEKHLQSEDERRLILLDQYHSEKQITFDNHSAVCKMCGQDLPEEEKEKLKAKFNTDKSEKLAQIIQEGNAIKETLAAGKQQLEDLEKSQEEYEKESSDLQKEGKALQKRIKELQEKNGQYEESEEYQQLVDKGLDIQDRITSEQESKQDLLSEIDVKKHDLQKSISELNEVMSLIQVAERQKGRMKELNDQRKEVINEFNEKQGLQYLAEEFFKTKIKLQEEKVNELFQITSFVFFGETESGEEKEMCAITVEGSDYHTNLNNAGCINAGLDIINTLSKAYGIAAPIFVDNAEGVNNPFKTESQMIGLYVSKDPMFRVEVTE